MCLVQDNRTPFLHAVYYGLSKVVSLFVNKYKVDPKQYDQVTEVHYISCAYLTSYIAM